MGRGQGELGKRMKSRIARAGVIAAEIVGVLVAATIVAAAVLVWRVQAAPVDLSWSASAFRAAANAASLNDVVRDIEKIELAKTDDRGGYRLTLENVSLGGKRSETSADLPMVVLDFYPADLIARKIGPRRILVDGAELRIVRRADRKLKLDFGAPTAERGRVFQALTGGAYFREAFERAALANATITFVDENSGRTWIGRGGAASIERTANGYAGNLASDFEIGAKSASLSFFADYDLATEIVSSRLTVVDAPVGDLVAVLFNENAELFTSPVSGTAIVDVSSDGTVLSSRIDLKAGAGVLTIGSWSTSVSNFAAVAGFDPKRNEFAVDRIEWAGAAGSGALAGTVGLEPSKGGDGVARVNFQLSGEGVRIDQPDLFSAPLTVDTVDIAGSYALDEKKVSVERIAARFAGVALEGGFSIARRAGKSAAVSAKIKVDGTLDPHTLVDVWPKTLAMSARNFVETRVPRAKFSSVDFAMELEEGAIASDGAIPDDAMTLSFRADDAEVIYAPGMTPMTNVGGVGKLKGNSFRFNADRGAVGAVRIGAGEVEIPVLMPKGEPAFFRFGAEGDAGDILAVLSQKPLAVLESTKFTAEQFSGPVKAKVEIQRPNLNFAPQESYRYKGVATFSALDVEGIIGDAFLTAGKGQLDLSTNGMIIKGDALVGEAPLTIEWRQRFFGSGDKTVINLKGVANSATADLFGVPTRQLAQGEMPFSAQAVGDTDAFRSLDLDVDLTQTVLISEALGWVKPQGVAAKGAAQFLFTPEGTKVSGFSVEGDGVSIAGEADFSRYGAVKAFNIPTFRLDGAARLSMSGRRDESGVLSTEVTGDYLAAGEMVRTLIEDGGEDAGKTPFALTARISRIDLRAGTSYSGAAIDFVRAAGRIEALDFSATGAGDKKLSIALNPQADAAGAQKIEARSDDVGAMLAAIFGVTSVKGGEGWLDFAFTPGEKDAPKTGALEAHDLRVVRAPLLAKIFAAGSLTGLADLMNGEGIELKNAMARFAIEDGAVRVSEARATGPSVGITAQGEFGLDGKRPMSLRGAVAPAYGVNSLLGKTPVIGDLFVSRKGEGVLALSYDVAGPASEPRVTVNPLSAFTPGLFRRMFEGRAPEEETPPTDENSE